MTDIWETHIHLKPYIPPSNGDLKGKRRMPDTAAVSKEHTRQLVEQARQGDKDAFGELYRHHHGSVYRLARFYLGPDAADDAAAETFLRAWNGLPRYTWTGAPFVSWLYGIARNVVFDQMRVRKRTEARADVPDRPHDHLPNTIDRLDLAMAMDQLPDEQRQVIEMKFLIGLPNAAVAEALGKTVGAVNAQQWRALGNLRRIIGETRS